MKVCRLVSCAFTRAGGSVLVAGWAGGESLGIGREGNLRTKASTYAILSVVEIARRQGLTGAGSQSGEIASYLNLPAAYVAKVLTQLVRAQILRSDRGPRGGFQLTRAPDEITFLDVVEAVDGPVRCDSQSVDGGPAHDTVHGIEVVFGHVTQAIRQQLASQKIAAFIKNPDRAAG